MNLGSKKKYMLTEGSVWKRMVVFALPIFLGQLCQQLYNTADSLIVGNYLGSNALAAVSSSGNLIFLFIGFFGGLSLGAGVIISRFIGAGDEKNTSEAVHTTVALGLVNSVILTAAGIIFTPFILRMMQTPDSVLDSSVVYFRIYFTGAVGFVMYNTLVGILQAAGDSFHPLCYLVFSSVMNIVLDIVFIRFFNGGVGSAALASAISSVLSAVLCFIRLCRTDESYAIRIGKIRFIPKHLKAIIKIGVPSGVQNSIIGFANVVVQSYINIFGEMAVAGSGAYAKIEGFAFLPITCFTMAMTTFISQNLGAAKAGRAKQGAAFGTVCSVVLAEIIGVVIYFSAPVLIGAFDSDPEVIGFGVGRARICTLFYFLLAYTHAMASVFRGAGKATVPMVIMLVCWCIIRVGTLATVNLFWHSIYSVNWIYPFTWSLSTVVFTVYFLRSGLFSKITLN